MLERSEETTQEKLSSGTISARKLLQGMSFIGLILAIVPLNTGTIPVFGISLIAAEEDIKGILIVTLVYLVFGFTVRSFTDIAASEISPFEKRLRKKINDQTEDILNRSMDRLANLFPSENTQRFHSESFESLLRGGESNQSKYNQKMMANTLREILDWKEKEFQLAVKNQPDKDHNMVENLEIIVEEYTSILIEILKNHEKKCKLRRFQNQPKWLFYRILILLRFWFFDALFPALFSVFVIVLLFGWIDKIFIKNFIHWMAG